MRYSVRFWALVCFVAILLLILPWKHAAAAADQVVLIVGGDVEWALTSRPPTVRYPVADPRPYGMLVFGKRDVRDQVTGDWPPIPYVYDGESKKYLDSLALKGGSDDSFGESLSFPLPRQVSANSSKSPAPITCQAAPGLTPTFAPAATFKPSICQTAA